MKYLTLSEDNFREEGSVILKDSEYHHLIRLLRYKEGDSILIRKRGYSFLQKAIIHTILKKEAILLLEGTPFEIQKPLDLDIHLYIPLLKKEALQESLEQAIQVGVSKITLLKTDYSVVDLKGFREKENRWQKILEQAGEQSGNPFIPTLSFKKGITTLKEYQEDLIIFAHHEPSFLSFKEILSKASFPLKVSLLVGPEGGLSEEELAELEELGAYKVYFPTYTLKAYTASLYLLSYVKSLYNELLMSDDNGPTR